MASTQCWLPSPGASHSQMGWITGASSAGPAHHGGGGGEFPRHRRAHEPGPVPRHLLRASRGDRRHHRRSRFPLRKPCARPACSDVRRDVGSHWPPRAAPYRRAVHRDRAAVLPAGDDPGVPAPLEPAARHHRRGEHAGVERGLGEGYIGLVLGANSILVAVLAIPVATRIEAQGPFRLLGAAAAIVAGALACYALIQGAGMALLIGTIVYSFGEIIFSSAVPAAVARLAPPGRRGAYQGSWTLVASLSMGSALLLSGLISKASSWEAVWLAFAVLTAAAAVAPFALSKRGLYLGSAGAASP